MMTETSRVPFEVAVRTLVAFSMRRGDLRSDGPLVSAFHPGVGPTDAIRLHQEIQKSRGPDYAPEVSVELSIQTTRVPLLVRGRIDGLYPAAQPPIIEEIKTTQRPLIELRSDNESHWGQLKLYAHMILQRDTEAKGAVLRLTYAHLESKETRELEQWFDRETLETEFTAAVDTFADWLDLLARWESTRNHTIEAAGFPHPSFRPGQRELAKSVYRTIVDDTQMFLEAPTGTGKTAACLFPAIKTLARPSSATSLAYLTARTTGRAPVEKELRRLESRGVRLKSLTLSAKRSICFNPEKACRADECDYARGYYDRIGQARHALFDRDRFTREAIENVASEHRVCPFELSLELASWVDLLVCDYNYAFDPQIRLNHLFGERKDRVRRDRESVLLIDEAHQLVDRARAMYSATLGRESWTRLTSRLDRRGKDRGLRKRAQAVARRLTHRAKSKEETAKPSRSANTETELLKTLVEKVRRFLEGAGQWMHASQEEAGFLLDEVELETRQLVGELALQSIRFLRIATIYDAERFVTLRDDTRETLTLFCTDPAPNLRELLDQSKAQVFMSATLQPLAFLERSIGAGPDSRWTPAASPFPSDHLCVTIADRVTTKFRARERTKDEVATLLATFLGAHSGNYLVFFPSFQYLQMVAPIVGSLLQGVRLLVQEAGMSVQAREQFLSAFTEEEAQPTVGFATLGGIFAEGIDLPGRCLSGAAIVGVGLPAVGAEREAIRSRFDASGESGFDFAYTYPGMQRVLQAAGRIIRTEDDRGSLLLVGERFTRPPYRDLLPRRWNAETVAEERELSERLRQFWKEGRSQTNDLLEVAR